MKTLFRSIRTSDEIRIAPVPIFWKGSTQHCRAVLPIICTESKICVAVCRLTMIARCQPGSAHPGHRPDRAGGATSSSRRGRPCSLLIGAMPRATLACVLCFEGMKAASKPRRGYIRAMDEEDLKGFERKFLGPARVVSLKDRLLSCEWRCSSCGLTVEDIIPIPVPAPCQKCNGIAFEAVDPVLQ